MTPYVQWRLNYDWYNVVLCFGLQVIGVIIAIDYDDTYTSDSIMWDQVIDLFRSRGHSVICVTGRNGGMYDAISDLMIPIVYAGSQYKRKAAERAGYKVDIWIDDIPEMIGESRILNFNY